MQRLCTQQETQNMHIMHDTLKILETIFISLTFMQLLNALQHKSLCECHVYMFMRIVLESS